MPNYPLWDQLNQLKEATWVDLTHTFDPEIPRFSEFEKVKFLLFSQSKSTAFTCNVGILSLNMVHTLMPLFTLLRINVTWKI